MIKIDRKNIFRMLLTDTLPYELPFPFSNQFIFSFINKYKLDLEIFNKVKEGFTVKLNNKKSDNIFELFSQVLFGKPNDTIKDKLPFFFFVKHKENQPRELSIPSVSSQIKMAAFYKEFKTDILYYCSRSSFSTRFPSSESKYIERSRYSERIDQGKPSKYYKLDLENQQLTHLVSFFKYKNYDNISSLYNSKEYFDAQSNFRFLTTYDISKCFDSIYTHSISWSVFGKELAKKSISEKSNFPANFDKLMQYSNNRETNGILIGPEISRIFSEIILQGVDLKILQSMSEENYQNGVDYLCLRYVDDFLLFYEDEKIGEKFNNILIQELHKYKLSLNSGKTKTINLPVYSNIQLAKDSIGKHLKSNPDKIDVLTDEDIKNLNDSSDKHYLPFLNFIKMQKNFLKNSKFEETKNFELSNFYLYKLEKKINKIIYISKKNLEKIREKRNSKKIYQSLLESIKNLIIYTLKMAFFISNCSFKATTLVRLSKMIFEYKNFITSNSFPIKTEYEIDNYICIECVRLLKKYKTEKFHNTEQIHIFFILSSIQEKILYKYINEDSLRQILNLGKNFKTPEWFNFMHLFGILKIIKKNKQFKSIRKSIEESISLKVRQFHDKNIGEVDFLILDSLTCPYLSKPFKRKILNTIQFKNISVLEEIKQGKIIFFTNWYDEINLEMNMLKVRIPTY